MKKKGKIVVTVIIALICITLTSMSLLTPISVDTLTLELADASLILTEQGHVREDNTMALYPLMSGQIVSLHVAEDDFVKTGDLICVIDASGLQTEIEGIRSNNLAYQAQMDNLDVEELKQRNDLIANRRSLQGEYTALGAQQSDRINSVADQEQLKSEKIRLQNIVIDQSRRDLENAQADLARAQILFQSGTLAKTDFEKQQNEVEEYRRSLEGNIQQLALINTDNPQNEFDYYNAMKSSLQAQISGIDTALSRSYTGAMKQYYSALIDAGNAQINGLAHTIESASLKSPVDGKITSLYAKDANIANPSQPLAIITMEPDSRIEIYVSTRDIDGIKLGDTVTLIRRREDGDAKYSGYVSGIDSQAQEKLSAIGTQERKVQVLVTPDEDSIRELKAGYDVDVAFQMYFEPNKLLVPKTALFEADGVDMIWRVEQGKAFAVPVTLGRSLRTQTVIESGVATGDIIIKDANTEGISEGARVKND